MYYKKTDEETYEPGEIFQKKKLSDYDFIKHCSKNRKNPIHRQVCIGG